MLSREQIQQFNTQGYTRIDDFISEEWLNRLKSQAGKLVDEWVDDSHNHTFSTRDNDRTGNHYFLESGEKICCFFEEDAFDAEGQLVQERSLCINKIGHALHTLDPVFIAFSHQRKLGEIAADLGVQQAQLRQSMYIFKQPRIGGVVNWHQDASFFYTQPQSVITYWFAIEDATLENGCLWVEPGGHKGPLRERFNRDGQTTTMVPLNEQPWPDDKSGLPLEVKAGTLLVFQGLLPHYSAPNHSSKSRQAYTLHVTDGACEYASQNWLQAEKLPPYGFDYP